MEREPIFIVGVQRSGTTLLSAMLGAHSRMSCGPETHFFRRLAQVDAQSLCRPETWPRPAAEFVTSITHTGFGGTSRTNLTTKYRIEEGAVHDFLVGREPSIAAALSSVTEQYMVAKGKQRWIEKTPDHLLHTAAIRTHFPAAPIVRIVRDPRDVALSLTKVPWGAKSFLEGLLYWERLDRASDDFFAADSRTCTLRFEDLVSSPAETLRTLCAFLGESFEPGMLDTSATGVEINSRGVPWKQKVSQSVDASRVGAWRSELTRRDNQLAEALLGHRMTQLGYPRDETFTRFGELYPGIDVAGAYPDALAAVASAGVRFWKARADERPSATVYLGQPGTAGWPRPGQRASGVRAALPVLADVARSAFARGRVYWVANADDQWTGWLSFVVKKCLAPHRVQVMSSPGGGSVAC